MYERLLSKGPAQGGYACWRTSSCNARATAFVCRAPLRRHVALVSPLDDDVYLRADLLLPIVVVVKVRRLGDKLCPQVKQARNNNNSNSKLVSEGTLCVSRALVGQ